MNKVSSIVGDLINFRGFVYAPINENGVVLLFGKVANDLDMYIEEIRTGFPDCIGRRFVGKGWERIRIEFEYKSRNFKEHGHDINNCDLIVCWEHNWNDCPIEVIELKETIKKLDNYCVNGTGSYEKKREVINYESSKVFLAANAEHQVKEWYELILQKVAETDKEFYVNVANKYIGWYTLKRSFASIKISKLSLRIECYNGGFNILHTKKLKLKPQWCTFSVKDEESAEKAVGILIQSSRLIKEAIANGESTSYFSKKDTN